MTDKSNIQKLQLHYYFNNDNQHSMNAFVSNQSESYLLKIIEKIAEESNETIDVKFEALGEGGVIKTILIRAGGVVLGALVGYLTTYDKRDGMLKDLDIMGNVESRIEEGKKVSQDISKYYETLMEDASIIKVGHTQFKDNNLIEKEKIVLKEHFARFIIEETNPTKNFTNDDIKIYLNMVTLSGKGNFRGNMKGESISFSISDKEFLEEVRKSQISFNNKTYLKGNLETTENNNNEKITYSHKITTVTSYGDDDSKPKNVNRKPKGNSNDKQLSLLFDNNN